jgi:hypothetical protein
MSTYTYKETFVHLEYSCSFLAVNFLWKNNEIQLKKTKSLHGETIIPWRHYSGIFKKTLSSEFPPL